MSERKLSDRERKLSDRRRSSRRGKDQDKLSRSQSVDDLNSVIDAQMTKYQVKPEYREITMTEMMKMYDPKWMAWVGLFASFIHAFSLPMFGFVLSQYIFVLDLPLDSPDDVAFFNE